MSRLVKRSVLPLLISLAVASPLSSWPVLAQQPVQRDGHWTVRMETNYGGKSLSTTITQCITKAQLSDPMNTLPGGPEAQQGCRMSNYTVQGQTATGTVICEGPPRATTTIEYVYKGEAFDAVMIMTRNGQTFTTKLTGTRLGECREPPNR